MSAEPITGLEALTTAQLQVEAVRRGAFSILDLFDVLPWYKQAADWTAWRAFLCALYGLPMTEQEYAIFRACTGRQTPPTRKVREAWVPVGRRGRKSAIGATVAVYEAGFRDHSGYLAKGERGRVVSISKDKDDAGAIHGFAVAILSEPGLSYLLEGAPIAEKIALTTGIDIVTRAARLTAGRSRAVILGLYDELAFWPTDESANPDKDIIRGVEPGMANIPHPLTLGMSSPYAKRGVLWEKVDQHYGQESDDVLVWMADTLTMHDTPAIREYVETAWRDDPVAAASEVGRPAAEDQPAAISFRGDVHKFVPPEVVDLATDAGVTARPPVPGVVYQAFVDPSGGSSDSMTLAVAHWAGQVVLDLAVEWPAPFDPDSVTASCAMALTPYGVRTVTGDRYAGEWPVSRFRAHGITYRASELAKSDIYLAFLPVLNSGRVRLLDLPQAKKQLTSLDRFEHRGGRDTIDHPKGQHDDVANAVAGVVVMVDQKRLGARPVAEKHETAEDIVRAQFMRCLQPKAAGGTAYTRAR